MKILFVHNEYQYKGGEDTTLEMEKNILEQKGHQVKVLLFSNQKIGSLSSKLKTGLQSFYNLSSADDLKKKIRSFQPDIIHVHNLFFTASPSILYAAKQMKIPVILTIQNFRLVCANALLLRDNKVCELCLHKTFPVKGIQYKCYRSSVIESALVTGITGLHKFLNTWDKTTDRIIVPSEFMKGKLHHSSLPYAENKYRVKPNFVHDEGFIPLPRDNFFLFVGRLSAEKGIHSLLECFTQLPHKRLVIAGDGPEKEKVMDIAQKNPSISYVGLQPKEKIIQLLKQSNALIFPSIWYEGLPLTIIEAFSTGTPVIASFLGAMTEMITDGYNGLHFQHGNINMLKEKIMLFSNMNVAERKILESNARQTYLNKYHPESHYKAIMNIYNEVIKG